MPVLFLNSLAADLGMWDGVRARMAAALGRFRCPAGTAAPGSNGGSAASTTSPATRLT